MAVIEDDLVGLLDQQEATTQRLIEGTTNALRAPLSDFHGWYDHSAIGAISKLLASLLRGFEGAAARQADSYMAQAISIVTGKKFQPVGIRRTQLGRNGVTNDAVLGRIANTYRFQQGAVDKAFIEAGRSGKFLDLATPGDAAFDRLNRIIGTNLQMAQRAQVITTMAAADRVQVYRRIIHPELTHEGTCGLCIAASDRLYSKAELLPIHPGCHCTVLPGTRDFDPHSVNEIDFKTLYRDASEFGKGTSAEALRKTRYKVDEHGEIGPVIRPHDEPIKPEPAKETNAERRARQRAELIRRYKEREAAAEGEPAPKTAPRKPTMDEEQQLAAKKIRTRRDALADAWRKIFEGRDEADDPDAVTAQLQKSQQRIDALDHELAEMSGDPLPEFGKIILDHPDPKSEVAFTNPRFKTGGTKFQINCSHCVTAYELRRRGYRVAASALPSNLPGRAISQLLQDWRDPDGKVREPTQTTWFGAEHIAENYPNGARGWITVTWKDGGGHVFSWEKRNGELVWIDPQRGMILNPPDVPDDQQELRKYEKNARLVMNFVRMDDLTPVKGSMVRYVDPSPDGLPLDLPFMDNLETVLNEREALEKETGRR